MTSIDVVGSVVATLGEGPVWDPRLGVLWWEDIEGRALHRYDPSSDSTESRETIGRPGSFALSDDPDTMMLATENELGWFRWASGAFEPWLELESGTGTRMNDGRPDHAGRFIVGSMWPDTDDNRFDGSLHRISSDGTHEILETDVGIANGLVFDRERARMYWADTFRATVWAWDYDLDSGARSNRRVFIDYEVERGLPDGACLDADGCYWSASVTGWAVTRFTPDGAVDQIIEVPVRMPTMPAFGGADLSTLYVTSLAGDPDRPDSFGKDGVAPGSLLAIDLPGTSIRGVEEPRVPSPT